MTSICCVLITHHSRSQSTFFRSSFGTEMQSMTSCIVFYSCVATVIAAARAIFQVSLRYRDFVHDFHVLCFIHVLLPTQRPSTARIPDRQSGTGILVHDLPVLYFSHLSSQTQLASRLLIIVCSQRQCTLQGTSFYLLQPETMHSLGCLILPSAARNNAQARVPHSTIYSSKECIVQGVPLSIQHFKDTIQASCNF